MIGILILKCLLLWHKWDSIPVSYCIFMLSLSLTYQPCGNTLSFATFGGKKKGKKCALLVGLFHASWIFNPILLVSLSVLFSPQKLHGSPKTSHKRGWLPFPSKALRMPLCGMQLQLNQGQASPFMGKIWSYTLNSCTAKTNSAINSFPVRPPPSWEKYAELSGGKNILEIQPLY